MLNTVMPTRQLGATLVEVMISMAVGLASLSAVASLVGYGIGVNAKLLSNARLSEELSVVNGLMIRDIKRAGFNGNTVAMVTDPVASPSAFNSSVVLSEYPGEIANSCIMFAYDANGNGALDALGTNENFGFRLRADQVEMRIDGLSCTEDGWAPLTEPEVVTITSLVFNLNQQAENNITSTNVTIALEGELTSNNTYSRQYSFSFLIRNYD